MEIFLLYYCPKLVGTPGIIFVEKKTRFVRCSKMKIISKIESWKIRNLTHFRKKTTPEKWKNVEISEMSVKKIEQKLTSLRSLLNNSVILPLYVQKLVNKLRFFSLPSITESFSVILKLRIYSLQNPKTFCSKRNENSEFRTSKTEQSLVLLTRWHASASTHPSSSSRWELSRVYANYWTTAQPA